ncbi:hypothetical protein V2W30_29795 [Streptomyces sp. Q6]|uniref:Uncharacterized protein n=1 Tax=Streptomyces citrinus TaxID=3118173 RepID=A0ACD5AIQ0_9ACTN
MTDDDVRTRITLVARNDQARQASEVFKTLARELEPTVSFMGPVATRRSIHPDDMLHLAQSLTGDVSETVNERLAAMGTPFETTVEVWVNGLPTDDD